MLKISQVTWLSLLVMITLAVSGVARVGPEARRVVNPVKRRKQKQFHLWISQPRHSVLLQE